MDIVDREIPLEQIGRTVGPRPSSALVRSIRRHGVLVPVLLEQRFRDDGVIEYYVLDGNRRVAAARHGRCATVPARVLRGISADVAARVTLAGNVLRASNHVTEFWAIRQLERSGVPPRAISRETGMSGSALATRKRLTSLERRIFVGLAEGRVRPATALAVTRLDRESQRALGDRFEAGGRLLKRDVDQMNASIRATIDVPEGTTRMPPASPEPVVERVAQSMPPVQPVINRDAWPRIGTMPDHGSAAPDMEPQVPAPVPDAPVEVSARVAASGMVAATNVDRRLIARWRGGGQRTATSIATDDDAFDALHDRRDHNESHATPAISHDLRLALRTIARQAAAQGTSEEGWVEAARDAWQAGPNHRLQS